MSTILDTVVSYEDQIVDYVKQAKKPVVEYVGKGVSFVEGRLPEVTYPSVLPTPIEVVETQAAFAKKLIDANTALVTAVLKTIAPVIGTQGPSVKAAAATKAA
jgi:hypothetical protein